MLKLLLLDAFRTIFDTYSTHTDATRIILDRWNIDEDPGEFHDRWDDFIMQRWRKKAEFKLLWPIFEDCLIQTLESYGVTNYDAPAAIKIWLELVAAAPPFTETISVVGPLTKKYRTAIVSNSDNFEMKICLDRLGLEFDAVFTSEDYRSYKPRPDIFHAALNHFGMQPGEAVMIGDSLSADIEGARNAGLRSIWINRMGKIAPAHKPQPDFTLPDLNGLPELLKKL